MCQPISSTLLTWHLDSGYESAVNRGVMIVTNMKYLLVCKFDKYSLRLHISILEKVVAKLNMLIRQEISKPLFEKHPI